MKIQETDKNKEIVRLLSEGLTHKEIAQKVNHSTRTVETYIKKMCYKYDCANSVSLVAYFLRNKIII